MFSSRWAWLGSLLATCGILSPLLRAYTFAGGTGDANDPYRIATAAQLISIGSDPNLLSSRPLKKSTLCVCSS